MEKKNWKTSSELCFLVPPSSTELQKETEIIQWVEYLEFGKEKGLLICIFIYNFESKREKKIVFRVLKKLIEFLLENQIILMEYEENDVKGCFLIS